MNQDHTRGIRDIIALCPDVQIYKCLKYNLQADTLLQHEYNFKYLELLDQQVLLYN